jgi:hypothetical protein
MERRSFLKAGTAGIASLMSGVGLLSCAPRAEAATISRTFYITGGNKTMPDGVSVYFKGYSDSAADLDIPATPIICQEGDTLQITIINRLSATHNFVIGGLKASNPPLASSGDQGMLRARFKLRPDWNTEFPLSFNLLHEPGAVMLGHY